MNGAVEVIDNEINKLLELVPPENRGKVIDLLASIIHEMDLETLKILTKGEQG